MTRILLRMTVLAAALTVLAADPALAGGGATRCERAVKRALGILTRASGRCRSGSGRAECLNRAYRRADRLLRVCVEREAAAAAVCGDGVVSASETCDETAPANGGCPEGFSCTACGMCSDRRCGDARVDDHEPCDGSAVPSGCRAEEACVACEACGRVGPEETADEDIAPCTSGIGDAWRFDVEAGTRVSVLADTVDAATAAKLAIEGTCSWAGRHSIFRAATGVPCTATPPNDPNDGAACPLVTFVAPHTGSCDLTVGVFPRLDIGDGRGCADPSRAAYRLHVGATNLTLVADDEPPGLRID